ncbi:P27 family phage terminase small subunit [Lentibacillus amyloliquefaciens]|uniref:Terminase n=1 Tax=Lentibacillus amyloliquefaciens TaxID=1472767 RepID=A0A0U4EIY5_9BACI|nr:P27 family phage terminase small subunit [Lentibacillus amyloliquefaciens]ALX50457.1 terminase [Lentibacillus amyloliquefaciens]
MAKKKIPTVDTIKKRTIEDMESLGVYKKEYRDLIDIYADTYYSYLTAQKEFEEGGRQFETMTAAGNPKKSGIVDSIEKLRKDIIAYSDRLCLSPKSLETVTAEKQNKSTLASVLSKLE